ncbi:MAG: hypothetical protein M0P04_03300 [Syntrophales bacterium]|nr:hypothetical protein [Syntrophales bacterium]MDD4192951.1 hypothetical protein [Mangrovibacterium sp.]HOG06788.1 hypothetical protein [Syntrophales bacterium]HOS76945.1 hypothetical protein [Syntrophales bacterium]
MKFRLDKQGTALLYLLVTLTVLAVLGTGVFYMTTTSSFSGLGLNAQNKARYLAEAGIRYAIANPTIPFSSEYKLDNTASDKFILEISAIKVTGKIYKKIQSTGVSNPGSPFQASYKIKIYLEIASTGIRQLTEDEEEDYEEWTEGEETQQLTEKEFTQEYVQLPVSVPFSFAGTGSGGITAITAVTGTGGVGNTDATGVSIDTGGQLISLGSGLKETYGCTWYQGWADSNDSDCIEGKCKFNKGIRAYFDFRYNTSWEADGFTFAVISAAVNTIWDCGGGSCGEYMAYAGPGTTGNGLQPPKIAVEFDPHIAGSASVCSGTTAQCGSRKDSAFSSPQKHAALTYWGTNAIECVSNTLDDNRHGNGDGMNDPENPENGDLNPDGTTRPYMIQDFNSFGTDVSSPTGKKLSFRLEIDRVDDSTSADYRKYKIRSWLKPYAVYMDSNGVTLDDTSRKFNKNNDYPPDFQQTITLTPTWHEKFDRILFGWTQGTGGSTQTVVITNFKIDFKNKNDF